MIKPEIMQKIKEIYKINKKKELQLKPLLEEF